MSTERLSRREIEEMCRRRDIPLDVELLVPIELIEKLCPDCIRTLLGPEHRLQVAPDGGADG